MSVIKSDILKRPGRVLSIDIFRGMTKLVMVFVNDLASVKGLPGWTYLSVVLIYFIVKERFRWLVVSLILLVLLNVASKVGTVDFLRTIPGIIWPVGSGSLASITMAGLLLSEIFLKPEISPSVKEKYLRGTGFAVMLFLAGYLLMPFELAKIGSTPSWCLYSAAICIVIFMALYWIVDMKHFSGWTKFIKPAGSNPLLTYPD